MIAQVLFAIVLRRRSLCPCVDGEPLDREDKDQPICHTERKGGVNATSQSRRTLKACGGVGISDKLAINHLTSASALSAS